MTAPSSTPNFIAKTTSQLPSAARKELEAIVREAAEHLQRPDLAPHTRSLLCLMSARARRRLADEFKVERIENLKHSYQELTHAVRLAPNQKDVAIAYGEAIQSLVKMNGFDQLFVQNLLRVDLLSEAHWTYEYLAPRARDPQVAPILRDLAAFLKLDA